MINAIRTPVETMEHVFQHRSPIDSSASVTIIIMEMNASSTNVQFGFT
jgi:hypothetical protein